MKYHLLSILMFLTSVALSQPTLTSLNYLPAVWDTVDYVMISRPGESVSIDFYENVTDTGQGLVWDFSSLDTANAQKRPYYIHTQDSSFVQDTFLKGSYNIVGGMPPYLPGWGLWNMSQTQMEYLGTTNWSNGNVSERWDSRGDTRIEMQFPFNYGDSFRDDYFHVMTTGGPQYIWDAFIEKHADGLGTLIIGTDTLTDILKVKTYWADNIGSDSNATDGYSRESSLIYRFYDGINPGCLLQVNLSRTWWPYAPWNETEPDSGGIWLYLRKELPAMNTSLLETTSSNIKLYPNPSKGSIFIHSNDEKLDIELKDIQGRELNFSSVQNEGGFKINTEYKGIAILRVDSEEGPLFRKLVFE